MGRRLFLTLILSLFSLNKLVFSSVQKDSTLTWLPRIIGHIINTSEFDPAKFYLGLPTLDKTDLSMFEIDPNLDLDSHITIKNYYRI